MNNLKPSLCFESWTVQCYILPHKDDNVLLHTFTNTTPLCWSCSQNILINVSPGPLQLTEQWQSPFLEQAVVAEGVKYTGSSARRCGLEVVSHLEHIVILFSCHFYTKFTYYFLLFLITVLSSVQSTNNFVRFRLQQYLVRLGQQKYWVRFRKIWFRFK